MTLQTRDHTQLDCWATALPAELVTLSAELAQVDQFLDDPMVLAPLAQHLDPGRGRPSLPLAQVLRLFYWKDRYQPSDRVLLQEVSDSFHWRQFCHLGLTHPVLPPTRLTVWRHRLGPAGIQALNEAVIQRLLAEKVVRGRRFRMDSTVTDANMHYPTDAGLLADGIRRLTRVACQVRDDVGDVIPRIRGRSRAVKRRILALGKVLRRRTGDAVDQVRQIPGALAQRRAATAVVTALERAARRTTGVVHTRQIQARDRLLRARDDVATVIAQSRAATAGHPIPDRVVSLADRDARPIKKGKLGQPVQFGYKIQVVETEAGFVPDYTVERGNPADVAALIPALDRHRAQFGRDPAVMATDRGYDSADNQRRGRTRPIRTVAIPTRGKKSAARQQAEPRPVFRRAQRWRAGGEGTISRLKGQYGLRRTRYRGHDWVTTGVGLRVFAHNVPRYPRRATA